MLYVFPLNRFQDILLSCGGYVIVWLLFVAFVAVNDGVVVGDRSAHEVNFHPTQVITDCAMLIFSFFISICCI